MIPWVWLIPTLAVGVDIGLVLMGCLVAGKIADLEAKLWASQMSWENPLPFLPPASNPSFGEFLRNSEPNNVQED